jgi:hypothetical protein
MRHWLISLWLELHKKHICEEKGCDKEAMLCHVLVTDPDDFNSFSMNVYNYYCTEHATKNGYCWMCGEFWAGNSEFDFNSSHLCPNCKDEVDAETVKVDEEYAGWF